MFRTIRFLGCLTITFRVPHYLFFSLFNYYVGMFRTIRFLICLTITFRVPHYSFFNLFNYYVSCSALFVF